MPSYGQGPSMGALAHQQQIMHHQFSKPPEVVPVFIGSISSGIGDAFLNELLSVSGDWSYKDARTDYRITRLAVPPNL